MAAGSRSPFWPLPAVTRKRWTFGAYRKGKKQARHHAGLDLYAPRGSPVIAPEGGELVRWQKFVGPNSVALLMQTDTGIVILFGEVEPNSWGKHGLKIGDRVEAGQTVAEVGINPNKTTMLHIETYTDGTRKNQRWFQGNPPPPALLNPTNYFKLAEALDGTQADDGTNDDDDGPNDDDILDDDHPSNGDPIQPDIKPDIHPQDNGDPIQPGGGFKFEPWMILAAALFFYEWNKRR